MLGVEGRVVFQSSKTAKLARALRKLDGDCGGGGHKAAHLRAWEIRVERALESAEAESTTELSPA